MDLMVVVPSHPNALVMPACVEKVPRRSPRIRFGIFYMSIAKDYIRSAAMVPAGQAIRKQAVRVVTVPVIIVARIVIGDGNHFAGRDDGAVRDTPAHADGGTPKE